MKKENLIKQLLGLYSEYLIASETERTVFLTNLKKDGKQRVVLKGNLDGFMRYLQDHSKAENE